MIRLPKPAGLVPSALLFVCALAARQSIAGALPTVPVAAPGDLRTSLPFVPGMPALPPFAGGASGESRPLPTPNAADGTWQEFNLLQVAFSLAVYDAPHDRLLSVGGVPRLENWALSLKGQRAWEPLPAVAEHPYFGVSTLDPSTGLVYYIFFAADGPEIHTLDPLTGTVSVIPGSQLPFGIPSSAPVMSFDPVNHRLVVLESEFPNGEVQVWVLDLLPTPNWSRWLPLGTPPPSDITYYLLQASVDPVRRRVVYPVPLASADANGPLAIWALTLDGPPQWLHFKTTLLPNGTILPQNRMVYDGSGDRVVTVVGQGDLLALSLETFQWSATPARNPGPASRAWAGVAIDEVGHRLLVCGGLTPPLYYRDAYSDAWALSLDHAPVWSKLVTDATRAPIRGGASDGYDPSRHQLVVFGGSDDLGGFRNDTWVVDLRKDPAWSPIVPPGTLPSPRYWHVSAWDPVRDQLVVFGGTGGDFSHPLADLWTLSFARGTPTWSQVTPAGPAPPGRMAPQLVYDSARDRFLLLQGSDGVNYLDDVWELRLSPSPAWRQLAPAGVPPAARASLMCVYDPARDRVLLFGGLNDHGEQPQNDLWALQLGSADGQWQQIQVAQRPSPRYLGLMRLDTTHDRLLLFGGFGFNSQEAAFDVLNDTWALDLAGAPAWRQLSPVGFLPSARDRANGAYDAAHDRLVLACGGYGLNDLWTLAFSDAPAAALPTDGGGRQGSGAVQAQTSPLALGMSAKVAGGRVAFAVQLPSGDPATLALFDIAGRSVWSAAVGQLGAGSHEVEMSGSALSPAIYFARLSQGGAARYARIAITP